MAEPGPTIAGSPTDPGTDKVALYERGFACFRDGELAGARDALERAIEIDPVYVEALRTLAMTYYRLEDYVRALAIGERHVAADPKDVVAHSSLSVFLMKNGRIKDAEDVAARAKVMTWKKQLKEGTAADAPGLSILDSKPMVESQPMMPLGISLPPRPKSPEPPRDPPPAQ